MSLFDNNCRQNKDTSMTNGTAGHVTRQVPGVNRPVMRQRSAKARTEKHDVSLKRVHLWEVASVNNRKMCFLHSKIYDHIIADWFYSSSFSFSCCR